MLNQNRFFLTLFSLWMWADFIRHIAMYLSLVKPLELTSNINETKNYNMVKVETTDKNGCDGK